MCHYFPTSRIIRLIRNNKSLESFQFIYLSISNLFINKEPNLQIPAHQIPISICLFAHVTKISLIRSKYFPNRPIKATFSIFLQFFPFERVFPISTQKWFSLLYFWCQAPSTRYPQTAQMWSNLHLDWECRLHDQQFGLPYRVIAAILFLLEWAVMVINVWLT